MVKNVNFSVGFNASTYAVVLYYHHRMKAAADQESVFLDSIIMQLKYAALYAVQWWYD